MSANDTTTRRPFRECTEVSQLCPVEMTVLSYYPNFGANIFFAVAFGLIVLVSATIGTWKRTWTFMALVTGGCVLETVGMEFPPCLAFPQTRTHHPSLQLDEPCFRAPRPANIIKNPPF